MYLRSINNNRIERTDVRNLKTFCRLGGNDPLKNIIMAMTFWDVVDENLALAQQVQLRGRHACKELFDDASH